MRSWSDFFKAADFVNQVAELGRQDVADRANMIIREELEKAPKIYHEPYSMKWIQFAKNMGPAKKSRTGKPLYEKRGNLVNVESL